MLLAGPTGRRGDDAAVGLPLFIPGPLVDDGGAILFIVFDAPVTLTAVVALARVAAQSGQVLPLQKLSGGTVSDIGSLTWTAGQTAPTEALAPTDFAPRDALLIPPASNPDAALADIAMSFS